MGKKVKDLSRHRDIVSRIRVDHDGYTNVLNELKNAYDDIGHTATPVCLLITGESRTGKSSVVRELLEKYMPQQRAEGTIRKIVYAVTPPAATVKSLLESLLKGLGDPHWSRGSQSNMTQRLYTQLEAVHCRMIILDEFQQLCDGGQRKRLDALADWLKVLLEGRKYGLVAVGLPGAASVVHRHPQLIGRFDDELRMPLFNWKDKASAAHFRGILRQFQKELHPFQLPPLHDGEMALRMYLASAGRIGLVAKLLDRAVGDAIRAKTLNIRLEDLAGAYARAIWAARLFPIPGGPFGADVALLSQKGVADTVMLSAATEAVSDESAAVEVHGPKVDADKPQRMGAAAPTNQTAKVKLRKRPGPTRAEIGRAIGRAL